LMMIAILVAVFADPDGRPARCRPALAPVISSMALPATLLLYTGAHTLSYTSLTTPIAPLAGGTALLLLVFLCLRRFAEAPRNTRQESGQELVRELPGQVSNHASLRASFLAASSTAAPEVAVGGVALTAVVLIAFLGLRGHELQVPPSAASAPLRPQHSDMSTSGVIRMT
jgi:protein-S-isoprenylcysteine O-methyltransferase Ste14